MSEAKELVKKMCDLQNSNPEIQKAMAGWKGVVQYIIDGKEEFYVEYTPDGKCSFKEGKSSAPTFTIISSSDLWTKVLKGQEDPVTAFMMGKYKIQGNLFEAQRLAGVLKKFRGML